MRAFVSLCLAGLMAFAVPAWSGDAPANLMGRWKEVGDSGAILWELSPEKIAITPISVSGKPLGDTNQIDVLFEPIKTGWAVVLRARDGSALGEGQAKLVGDTLMVVLPGVGTHELKRFAAR